MCRHLHERERERLMETYRDVEQSLVDLETDDPPEDELDAEPVIADD